MVDPFYLEVKKEKQKKWLSHESAKAETEKKLHFHRVVEIKQPHTMTEPRKTFSGMEPSEKNRKGLSVGFEHVDDVSMWRRQLMIS